MRELWLGAELIKRFTSPAGNQEAILAEFQKRGWPAQAAIRLPDGSPYSDQRQRLNDAARRLNRHQIARRIGFHVTGNGHAIRWELLE